MVDDNINLRVTDPIKHSIIVTADNVEYYDDNPSFFKIEKGLLTEEEAIIIEEQNNGNI